MKIFNLHGERYYIALLALYASLSFCIVASVHLYYKNFEKKFRNEVEQQLSAVAELKVNELSLWRKERYGDAFVLHENPAFTSLVRAVLTGENTGEEAQNLMQWLAKYTVFHQYDSIRLVNLKFETKFAFPENQSVISTAESNMVHEVLKSGKVTFLDFYRNEHDGRIYLGLLVPFFNGSPSGKPMGALIFNIDPNKYLFPFINQWPTTSKTAETMLLRREIDSVVFLNELRFKKNTALTLRVPLNKTDVPSVLAVMGRQGIVNGVDYRGIPVIAYVRNVPDSPWFLVAREDAKEMLAPMREKMWMLIMFVGVILSSMGIGIGWVLWRQQLHSYKEKYKTLQALTSSQNRYQRLFESAKDGILIIDAATGIIEDVNPFMLEMIGYPRDRFIGGKIWELEIFGTGYLNPDVFNGLKENEAFRLESLPLETADGRKIDTEFVGIVYQIEKKKVIHCNFRDNFERKQIEEAQIFILECGNKGDDFFESLTRWLAERLRMDFVCIDRLELDSREAVTLSVYFDGQYEDNFRYSLKDTPCGDVVGKKTCCFPSGVRQLFPADEFLWKMSAESYVGTILSDSKGDPIGLIVAIGRQPIAQPRLAETILKLVSLRASGEMERRDAEEALRESEKKYRQILDLAQEGIWSIDKNYQTTFVNPRMAEMLGYTTEEMVGTQIFLFVREQGIDIVQQNLDRLKKGINERYELEFYCKNGKQINTKIISSPIMNDEGNFNGAIFVISDITRNKRYELMIRSNSRMLERFSAANSVDDIFSAVIEHVNQIFPDHPASILLLDNSGLHLKHAVSTGLPDFYNQAIDNLEIGPSVGSCGAAAFTGKQIIVEDIEHHPNWQPFLKLTRRAGLRACWSEPIKNTLGRVIGTFAIYNTVPALPNAEDLQVLEDTARETGLVLDRRQVVDTLRQNEEQLRLILNSTGEAIYGMNLNAECVFCNTACIRMLGYENAESLIGRNMHAMIHHTKPDGTPYPVQECEILRTFENGGKEVHVYDEMYWRADGTGFHAECWSYPQLRNGVVVGSVVVFIDITQRKRDQENLIKFKQGIEQSMDVTFITDSHGNIQYVNPAFRQVYGYMNDEILGKTPRILKSGRHNREYYRDFWRTLLNEGSVKGEFINKTKEGQFITMEASANVIRGDHGEILGFLALQRDITLRKRADEDLKQAKMAAEVANVAKSAFLANMSHELRTPLNGILGMAQLLLEPYYGVLNPEQERFTRNMINSGNHLLELINEILDLSKIESGKMEFALEDFSPAAVIQDVVWLLNNHISEKQLTVIQNIDLAMLIKNDERKFKQVILNLFGNAIKFTKEGGRVELCSKLSEDGKDAQFFIHDNGIGIKQDDFGKIFEYFQQVDLTYSRSNEGTGLGLAISKKLIEGMGGRIWFTSEYGKGSTFAFSLPYSSENKTSKIPEEAASTLLPERIPLQKEGTHPRKTVLLIEDNQLNAELVIYILNANNYVVHHFIDASHGIQCARSTAIDLILMDIQLPDMDGFTAARILKREETTAHIPIIALTANAMKNDEQAAQEIGFERYITKPFDIKSFLSTIDEIVNREHK